MSIEPLPFLLSGVWYALAWHDSAHSALSEILRSSLFPVRGFYATWCERPHTPMFFFELHGASYGVLFLAALAHLAGVLFVCEFHAAGLCCSSRSVLTASDNSVIVACSMLLIDLPLPLQAPQSCSPHSQHS